MSTIDSIGAFLKDPHYSSSPYVGVDRKMNNYTLLSFQYILLHLIMIKIVSGTIIDTFATMTTELKEKLEDIFHLWFQKRNFGQIFKHKTRIFHT